MSQKFIILSNGESRNMDFEEVREVFKPMLFKEMRKANGKFVYNQVEEEDFMQELEIELWRAFDQYNPKLGNCFSTYLFYKLKKGVRNVTYPKYSQKNQNNGLYSMNAEHGEDNAKLEDFISQEDTSIDSLIHSELKEIINSSLNDGEGELLKVLVDKKNNPVQVYADKYGISRQAANQRVIKLKKKLQQIVMQEYL